MNLSFVVDWLFCFCIVWCVCMCVYLKSTSFVVHTSATLIAFHILTMVNGSMYPWRLSSCCCCYCCWFDWKWVAGSMYPWRLSSCGWARQNHKTIIITKSTFYMDFFLSHAEWLHEISRNFNTKPQNFHGRWKCYKKILTALAAMLAV